MADDSHSSHVHYYFFSYLLLNFPLNSFKFLRTLLTFNMFHVFCFGLLYYWFFMVYPTIFPLFREHVHYHWACMAQVRSHLSFFKLTDTQNEAHETCSTSWSGDRNFFLTFSLEFPQFFPEVSFIFFQKYAEFLTNYWRKILRKLEKNY